MDIITIPLSQIKPAEYNPRKDLTPRNAEYKKIERSLEEFGLVQPLVWNKRSGNLVGGHQRYKVLQAQGDEFVQVSVVDLPPGKEKALNLALNKISGQWDDDALSDVIQDLVEDDEFDIVDLDLTGFDTGETDAIIEDLLKRSNGEETFDVDAALGDDRPLVTHPGDLIELGKHRVLCGDSTKAGDVQLLLGSVKPGLMVTDPPYGVNYDPAWRQEAHDKGLIGGGAVRQGAVTNDNRCDWLEAWELFQGDVAYVWHAALLVTEVQNSLVSSGYEVRSSIVWRKQHFCISRGHYHFQHECCFYCVRKGRSAKWTGGYSQTTIWDITSLQLDHIRKMESEDTITSHSTQKPLECMARPIRNHGHREVYDPFLGSGTTLIAAESLNRRCFGIEIEPRYCDVIVRRFIDYVGEQNVDRELAEKYR